jgi:purine nucleosidase
MKKRILYDTDLIGDDLLTIIIGMGLDNIKFEGITSFGRSISSFERAALAENLIDLLSPYSIRVAAGANAPLVRSPREGCNACNKPIMEFKTYCNLKNNKKSNIEDGAINLITSIIKENQGEITLLCTGPLTNIALALKDSPEIANMVKEVIVMGGTAWTPGNISPVAESNIYNDPEAAKIVFDCFPNITMVGLDVTLKVLVDDKMLNNLNLSDTVIGKLAKGIILSCINEHKRRGEGINAMPLHDPLALMIVFKRELIKTVNCEVNIETCGTYTTGQTVCRPVTPFMYNNDKNIKLVKVATEVNNKIALEVFSEALCNACNKL